MRLFIIFGVIFITLMIAIVIYNAIYSPRNFISPVQNTIIDTVKPLEKYSFENLKKTPIQPSPITLGKVLKEDSSIIMQVFYYTVDNKKVSGVITRPQKAGTYPIIVMHRGYVPRSAYTPGAGTWNSSQVFAQNGYVTIAADFLGFGESDRGAKNQLENRFQTYPTALTLLASLDNLNPALEQSGYPEVRVDSKRVGIWGHSNGGHISLAVLALSGKPYPTVLWNPVSTEFPYSVFFFMDEEEDHGKKLRKDIADFEEVYEIEKYSPPNYYKWITAPIQLHQGAEDILVPQRWSDQLVDNLKAMDKDIEYFVYPGNDHQFGQGAWNTVVQRNITFYDKYLK